MLLSKDKIKIDNEINDSQNLLNEVFMDFKSGKININKHIRKKYFDSCFTIKNLNNNDLIKT